MDVILIGASAVPRVLFMFVIQEIADHSGRAV
jgi:hypothetical protein